MGNSKKNENAQTETNANISDAQHKSARANFGRFFSGLIKPCKSSKKETDAYSQSYESWRLGK